MRRLKAYFVLLLLFFATESTKGQTLTYQFTDPCTKVTTFFSVPATGTTIFFLGKSAQFTSADVASGAFATWINQAYTDYRKVSPCSVQSGQVTQNQITSQIIGNTVQSVVGSIMSQAQSAASGTEGGNDAASKDNKDNDKKKKNEKSDNTQTVSSSERSNTGGETGGNSSNTNGSGSGSGNAENSEKDKKEDPKAGEVAATTTMNIDTQNQNDAKSDNSGGGKGGKSGGARTNPVIVSSDFTTAQNLDKTFTPILNLSMSQSSMTGMSSWGSTAMIWFNFKQFALSGKYTKMKLSKNGKLKWINNINLTAVYTYGNVLGFIGYSGILNAGKWGVTGFNTSAAATLVTQDKTTFISPSITAFYTKPFKGGKRLTISPELYLISTPLIYSTKDKITTTDRTFSMFLGSGFDYQLTRRFKFNANYKLNLSTNPDFPILSFILIGSKVNL